MLKKNAWILALIAVLAVGFVGCDGDSPSGPSGGSVVWEVPSFTGLTKNTTDGKYLANGNGLQLVDGDNSSWAIAGSTLEFTVNSNYKAVRIQVGNGTPSGTNYYVTAGNYFQAETGKEYKLTVKASVKSGTGQLRFKVNNQDPAGFENLTTTPQTFTTTWTQVSHNVDLCSRESATGTVIVFHSMSIEEL